MVASPVRKYSARIGGSLPQALSTFELLWILSPSFEGYALPQAIVGSDLAGRHRTEYITEVFTERGCHLRGLPLCRSSLCGWSWLAVSMRSTS